MPNDHEMALTRRHSVARANTASPESPSETDDLGLAAATGADPAAFAVLYERFYPKVYRYCRTRVASHEDCADLTQQVFLQALGRIDRFEARGQGFAAWLFRIAHNAVIDLYRRQKAPPPVELDDIVNAVRGSSDPEATALVKEEYLQLGEALERLSQSDRDLVALRFAGGLTIREIADVTGKSESATQKRLWRALQSLRKEM